MDLRLRKAVQAIKDAKIPEASRLLASLLKDDPQNEQAWLFLAVCVGEPAKKMECLQRVLDINPRNQHALRAREKLLNSGTPQPAKPFAPDNSLFFDFLDRLIGLLFQLPAAFYIVFFVFVFLLGAYAYTNLNTDYLGLTSPNFASLIITDDYQRITDSQGASWRIVYEGLADTTFEGKVRHVSVNRINKFPFVTHDILITSGDYADPDLVYTNVTNHRFYWQSRSNAYPKGSINLLHVVPENEEVYRQMLKIRNGDTVSISGREILKIDAFTDQGDSLGWWKDDGCNTTLVKDIRMPE